MILAVGVGFLIYRTRVGVLIPTIIALIVMYITICIASENWFLTGISIAIFVLAIWLVFEACNAYRNRARDAT